MTPRRPRSLASRPAWRQMLLLFLAAALLFGAACDDEDDNGDGTAVAGDDTPTATATQDGTPGTGTGTATGTASPGGPMQGSDRPQVAGQYGLAPSGSPTPGPTAAAAGGNAVQQALQANIGQEAPQDLIGEWNIDILPDGEGLPEGEGDVSMGADIYASQCAQCHGSDGTGTDLGPRLILTEGEPGPWEYGQPRTVANYWPYLTTYMDYINRAMPFDNPTALTADELYAVTAWILAENNMIEDDATLDRDRVIEINELPNLPSFLPCYPDECRPEPELQSGGAQ